MRDYRFDFSNGTTDLVETFSVRTGYVRFYEMVSGGGVDPRIRVESMGGGWSVVLRPGQGFRLPAEEQAGVVITNLAGTAMVGLVKLGPRDWEFEDQRLTGTVAVVDSNFALTQASMAFSPYYFQVSAAGVLAHIQLLNPVGSGRLIEIQALETSVSAATGVSVLLTTGLTLTSSAGVSANQNKAVSGGSNGVLDVRFQNNATALQSTRGIWGPTLAAAGSAEKTLRAPIILLPGDGVLFIAGAPTVNLVAGAQTVERPTV
jgi:hypothetical protein